MEERSAQPGDPFDDFADAPILLIRGTCCTTCIAEVRQIEVGGDATQLQVAANVLVQARAVVVFDLGRGRGWASELKAVPSLVFTDASQLADRFSTAQAQPSS